MLFCYMKNIVGFVAAKALDESEFEGIEPELRGAVLPLIMDVRRLEPVGQIEKEAETAFAPIRGGKPLRIRGDRGGRISHTLQNIPEGSKRVAGGRARNERHGKGARSL